jgi:hypothetical protein
MSISILVLYLGLTYPLKQKRIYTVREAARARGFPGHLNSKEVPAQCIVRLGMAVPIPLGAAIVQMFEISRMQANQAFGDPKESDS